MIHDTSVLIFFNFNVMNKKWRFLNLVLTTYT